MVKQTFRGYCRPRAGILGVALLALLVTDLAQAQFGGRNRGRFGSGPDIEVAASFDADKNGWLDRSERMAAMESLSGGRNRRGSGATTQRNTPVNELLTPAQVKQYPGKDLYDLQILRTVFIQFEDSDWEAQLTAFKGTDIDVPATVVVDGKTYRQVGVHFRGNTTFSSVPDGYKRSLKLSFDFVDKKQRIQGHKALELNNSAADATYLNSVLYLQAAREYFPASKANFMRVAINGESWGIYINSQPFNSDFIAEATGSDKGARFKVPGSPRSRGGLEYVGETIDYYRSSFEITSKDREESWRALIKLTRTLNQTPPDKLEAALQPLLDVDQVLRFLALENVFINNDGYWVRASDYNLYQDAAGVFHVVPHDVNEVMREIERMGMGGGRLSGVALDPLYSANDPSKPLLSKLLAVPSLRLKYLGYVQDMATRWLDWKRIEPLAQQYQALIAADVKRDKRKLYSNDAFVQGLTTDGIYEGIGMVSTPDISLRSFMQQRQSYLFNWLSTRGAGPRATGT